MFICRVCGYTEYVEIIQPMDSNIGYMSGFYKCIHCSSMFTDPIQFSLKPLNVKKVYEDAVIPTKAYESDTGFDLYAIGAQIIKPGKRAKIETGIAIEPEPNIGISVRPRSGLSKEGIIIGNPPGTVDQHYRDSIKVLLYNISREPYTVEKHQRVAQLVPEKVLPVQLNEVSKLSETDRGTGGWGHSGK